MASWVSIDVTHASLDDMFRACNCVSRRVAIGFRIAGSETSSTAMTHTLMYLVQNPKALKRLREELDQATASNPPGALPTYDQVRNLPYLTACINESMRLRPVAASGEGHISVVAGEDSRMPHVFKSCAKVFIGPSIVQL